MNSHNSKESVIGFEPLYQSMLKCRKGVMWKDSTASFYLNGIERTIKLSEQLQNGSYKPRKPIHFQITSPKPREIASITFRDRVYQRSLNDNVVYPAMCRSFIHANFACQKGKGTDAAREQLKAFLRKYYREHGNAGYVAQFDIHGYYPNMNHDVAETCFREKIAPEMYEMVESILRDQYTGEKGYEAGSQLIQIAGISVLNDLDHYIKEVLHARFYLRYMDDFMIISHDKQYLETCMRRIISQLSAIGYEVNRKKTRIYSLSEGIDFLGFLFHLTGRGRVLMFIRPENVKRERKKLKRLVAKSKNGDLPRAKVYESYAAWRNHASKGNTHNLILRMDKYYTDLWEGMQ